MARAELLTGMRSYPFRDWRRSEGLPAVPGYNPIWDWQPVMTETMRRGGVRTVYVTDNPIADGPRFPEVRRPGGSAPDGSSADGIEAEMARDRNITTVSEYRMLHRDGRAKPLVLGRGDVTMSGEPRAFITGG